MALLLSCVSARGNDEVSNGDGRVAVSDLWVSDLGSFLFVCFRFWFFSVRVCLFARCPG